VTAEECYNEYQFWLSYFADTGNVWALELAFEWLDLSSTMVRFGNG